MEKEAVIVRNLYKSFDLGQGKEKSLMNSLLNKIRIGRRTSSEFYALENVSFSLLKGEMLGLVGNNGSGKSTLLKILSEVMYPSSGEVIYKGQLTSILEIGSGFHPELSGRANAVMYASLLGYDQQVIENGMDEIVEFSEIGKYIDQPVKYYSSGMYLRLAFAVAFYCNVDILVLDEVLSVGDAAFMIKCQQRIKSLLDRKTSIIFASHRINDILKMCDRCIWLENGKVVKIGQAADVAAAYLQSNRWTSRNAEVSPSQQNFSLSNLSWTEHNAPSNEFVKLRKISVCSTLDVCVDGIIDYNDPIRIKVEYDQTTSEGLVYCGFVIIDQFNTAIVISNPQYDRKIQECTVSGRGLYRVTCIVPAKLLNIGFYRIYLRFGYDIIKTVEMKDIAFFKIVSHDNRQRAVLESTPLSICAALDWKIEKVATN